jgi:hypothetical protein
VSDPRKDPIGTVRRDRGGRTTVKVSMGDGTGKGQHVWCRMDDNLDVFWNHHVEVAGLPVVDACSPTRATHTVCWLTTSSCRLADEIERHQ